MLVGLSALLAGMAGCVGQWRPPTNHLVTASRPSDAIPLKACIGANRLGRWIYERSALPADPDQAPAIYSRRSTRAYISEGVLEERSFLPIERYVEPVPSSRSARAAASEPAESNRRPRAPLQGGTGIFFRIDEPADPMPPDLESSGRITSSTRITYFDYRGIPQARGTLTRVSEIEGTEDVECPAGRFEKCVRVRVDLQVYFPWVAIVDLTSYLWLSPEIGEVRRVQRFSGWFLIFPFASADDHRLVSYAPLADHPAASEPVPPPMWSAGAVLLEGDYPRIRVSGMVVDLAR